MDKVISLLTSGKRDQVSIGLIIEFFIHLSLELIIIIIIIIIIINNNNNKAVLFSQPVGDELKVLSNITDTDHH